MQHKNKVGIYFILSGLFLILMIWANLWKDGQDAIAKSIMASEKEINARLDTAASVARILSGQMERILRNNSKTSQSTLDVYNDIKNNYWYADIKEDGSNEEHLSGALSGIGDYNTLDTSIKEEINSALELQINFSGTAYRDTYSWIYYISKNKFIYVYPKVSKDTYHLTENSYKGTSWKYADQHSIQMTPPYLDAAGTGYVVAFYSSVYKNGQFTGVVAVEINLKYITQLVQNQGVTGNYYVITGSGLIVNSAEPEKLGSHINITITDNMSSFSSIQGYRLHVIQPTTNWLVLKNIYLKALTSLIIIVIFLFILYSASRYLIYRNDISEKILFQALKNKQFVPYAQPIVSTSTGDIAGCEILVRWVHPLKGIIPPDEFIPFAERSGVIIPITYDLMKTVSTFFRKNLMIIPEGFHIAINICPDHLAEESLLEHCLLFMKTLNNKVELILEITERNNFIFTPHVNSRISMLLRAGISFALDDFGTGYSTHSYLQKIRATYIKIDRSFIQMIGMDEISHHIVRNVIHLAENVQLKIVAEGVETAKQAAYLKENNISYQQGYFYGKPIPLDKFTSQYLSR